MKARLNDRHKFQTELERLNDRLAAARAESSRLAASRPGTARKLDDIGRRLARLEAGLAEATEKKAPTGL